MHPNSGGHSVDRFRERGPGIVKGETEKYTLKTFPVQEIGGSICEYERHF
jgi:hypothetical protein